MTIFLTILFAFLGCAAGALHFTAIAIDARLTANGGSVMRVIGLKLGRLAVTVAVLIVAAFQGWTMLLAATAGFLAARLLVLRRLGVSV